MESRLLAQSQLSIVTRHADAEMSRIHSAIEHKVLVEGRADLETVLGQLLACAEKPKPKTLDLIGHSTPNGSMLQLGDWVIDTSSSTVTAYFRELADYDVLPRLGIHAIRLLGCNTAGTSQARSTICVLSDILGLEVFGTTGLIFSAHYRSSGFDNDWRFLLVGSSDVRAVFRDSDPRSTKPSYDRALDVDALPAVSLEDNKTAWPRRVATEQAARNILRLVRRREGSAVPGLLATPSCEIAIPSSQAGLYHLAQVVLDSQFVRVYPEGSANVGVLYPVQQPDTLRSLVEDLPEQLPAAS